MFMKCQQFCESLDFLKEIGDRPESQVKEWGLSRGQAELVGKKDPVERSAKDLGPTVARYGSGLWQCTDLAAAYMNLGASDVGPSRLYRNPSNNHDFHDFCSDLLVSFKN